MDLLVTFRLIREALWTLCRKLLEMRCSHPGFSSAGLTKGRGNFIVIWGEIFRRFDFDLRGL